MNEKIKVNGDQLEIDTKPITIICQDGCQHIQYDRVEISPAYTIPYLDTVTAFQPDTQKLVEYAFNKKLPEFSIEWIKREGSGMKHLTGLIDSSLYCISANIPFMWQFPESHLHRSIHVKLADILIYLTLGKELVWV